MLGSAVVLGCAGAAQGAVTARPGLTAVHPIMRPTIVPRGPGHGVGRVPRIELRRARRGYGYGVAGIGLAGLGLGTIDGGFAAPPPEEAGSYPPPLPPPFAVPPPPPCPLIIEVGRGLAHRVKTRVVYGAPVCGR